MTGWGAGQRVRIGILTKVFTTELVDAATAKHDRAERRRRLLSARLVVYFVLALCLLARESYEEVLRVLTSSIPGSRALALDGTQFDLPDSSSNGDTFDGPSTTGGVPFGFPQVRAVVLAEIGTHGVLDDRLGGYRDGERSLAYLLVRLQSNHLGTVQEELPDGSYLSMARPGKEVRLRATRGGRTLPQHVIYRVITFAKDDKVAYLGTTLPDPEQYPADELVALYRERWEIEFAFDEIKNHLGPGGPIRSRTPEGVRQELWAHLAVHHAIRQFAHAAALAHPSGSGHRPCLLLEVRPHHPPQHPVPARSDHRQAHPLLQGGRTGGTQPSPSGPPRPKLPACDQEAEPMAGAQDPCQTQHGAARPLGPQPDLEAEDTRRAGRPALKGT